MCETYVKFHDLYLKPQLIDFWGRDHECYPAEKKTQFLEYEFKGTKIGLRCCNACTTGINFKTGKTMLDKDKSEI